MNVDQVSNRIIVPDPSSKSPADLPSPDLLSLLNQLRTGVVKIAQGDTTANRPNDPLLYEIYFDTTLGQFVYCTAVRNNATPAAWSAIVAAPQRNYLVDGSGYVAQGALISPAAALQYGSCDAWKVGIPVGGGGLTGQITQAGAGVGIGRTGIGPTIQGCGATGPVQIRFRTFVESRDAIELKNATASISGLVAHSVITATSGVPSYQITISKATVLDNFAAITQIGQSALIPVPTLGLTVPTTIQLNNVAMGDCSNGVCVDVDIFIAGTISLRTFRFGEFVLSEGSAAIPFLYEDFGVLLERAQRYFQKSFAYAVGPAQATGSVVGAASYRTLVAGATAHATPIRFATPMRATPTMTYFSPSSANTTWRNNAGTDSGVAASSASLSEQWVGIENPQVAGDAVGNQMNVHWTADARF
jgi:hypothetical protein